MDKNNKSFTLIELLVVASITILLSGISLVMVSSYKDERRLNIQVNKFIKALEFARDKAEAGDAGLCSDSSTAHVNGYTVVVDPTAVRLIPGCDSVPTPIIYPIEQNILFVTPSFSIQFDAQRYQGNTLVIPVKDTLTNKCKEVSIDETGLITNANAPCP